MATVGVQAWPPLETWVRQRRSVVVMVVVVVTVSSSLGAGRERWG